MDEKELRAKRLAVREQIQDRMQKQLEERKQEIKTRIKKEKIPLAEKRRRYRREVLEEKLALMKEAKLEFRARKRMLGLAGNIAANEPPSEPPPIPEDYLKQVKDKKKMPAAPHEDEFTIERSPGLRPEEAFIYDDKTDSDASEFVRPIDASDMLPFGAVDVDAEAVPEKKIILEEERKSLIYYIVNVIIHPVQTLDEFDEYLTVQAGIFKIGLFYIASLLPVIAFVFIGEDIALRMPQGLFWKIAGANVFVQNNIGIALATTVLGLLFITSTIAAVNYFFADDANFLTLLIYFGFVDAVSRILIYTLVIAAAFASFLTYVAPAALGTIAVLFVVLFFWRAILNIIVLMSTYGYDWYSAILLSYGANVLQGIVMGVILGQIMGVRGF